MSILLSKIKKLIKIEKNLKCAKENYNPFDILSVRNKLYLNA